jgi:hypothetical protein
MPTIICGTKQVGVWVCPTVPPVGVVIDVREQGTSRLYRVAWHEFTAHVIPGTLTEMTCSCISVLRMRPKKSAPAEEEADPIVWRGTKKVVVDVCTDPGNQVPDKILDVLNEANAWDPDKDPPNNGIAEVHHRVNAYREQMVPIVVRKSGKVELLVKRPK